MFSLPVSLFCSYFVNFAGNLVLTVNGHRFVCLQAWGTNGYTPILSKSLLISKTILYFDDLAKCFYNNL